MGHRFKIRIVGVGLALVVAFACDKESSPQSSGSGSQSRQPAPQASTKKTVAVDSSNDDPSTPTWLPKPQEIPGWVRVSNVRVVDPRALDDTRRKRLGALLESFSLESVMTFKYESTLPEPGGVAVAVTLVQAHRSLEAYALATCMMPAQPRDNLVGSMSCVENSDSGTIVHGWQGNYYVHVAMDHNAGPPPVVSVEKLAAGLVRPIPTAEPPALLRCLPAAKRVLWRTWLTTKHLHVLPPELQKRVLRGGAVQTTKALGLGAGTTMVVAAYDPGGGEELNYVWVVEYPAAGDASDALGRYKSLLRRIKPAPLVLMDMPRDADGKLSGRYLCGTWTADQESIMHVLPEIVAKLPK